MIRTLPFIALLAGSPLLAQTINPGDRVRITLPERRVQETSLKPQRLILRGDVVRVASDTIFLRPEGTIGELGVARSSAKSLHRSAGMRSRRSSALLTGGLIGFYGAMTGAQNWRRDQTFGLANRWEAATVGALVGAMGGAAFGALRSTERWRRVPSGEGR